MLAGAAIALAHQERVRLPDLALLHHEPVPFDLPVGAGPDLLGALHESLLSRSGRRASGAFYTPASVAMRLVGWAVAGMDDPLVCDPACGGGVFLLAASRHTRRLLAIDIDPLAVAVTEAAVFLATGRRPQVMVADALLEDWPEAPDVVVGNPPFLSQMASGTVRDRRRAELLVERWGEPAAGYVDDAALFLLASARRARRSVALLQPASVLAAAGAAMVRAELAPLLERLWVPEQRVFADAAVSVVGVVTRRGLAGPALVDGDRWAPLLATARGVPPVCIGGHGTLGERCTVSAGFRDEYYGLAPFVAETGPGAAPLITSGLIDPAVCLWGSRPTRYGRSKWEAPAVDLAALSASPLAAWAERHLVPKVLVATQTRAVEAVVDELGDWLPCTPVLSVFADDLDVWHVLAALLAPPVTAWAMHESAGAALSGDALKLSAAQLRRLPLPAPGTDWDEAAAAVRDGDLLAAGAASCRAHGVHADPLLGWWADRLPVR